MQKKSNKSTLKDGKQINLSGQWSWNQKDWVPIGLMEVGFSENRPPLTKDLSGKELTLYYDQNDWVIKYVYDNVTSLRWEILEGIDKGSSDAETYEAIKAAPQICLAHFVTHRSNPPEAQTIVLDLTNLRAMTIIGTLVEDENGHQRVRQQFLQALVNRTPEGMPIEAFERTKDLIGKRVRYTYSKIHTYEHIYLNDRLFTWHCLTGPEAGLADTENCSYYKIASKIYLFTWWEKIIPCHAVVLINLETMRSVGAFFGFDHETRTVRSFTMGSYGEVLR